MINGRFTLDEAAARLHGSTADPALRIRRRAALWRAIRRGELPAIPARPGRSAPWLVAPADLKRYAARRLPAIPPDLA